MIPLQHQHINLIKTASAHDCLQRIWWIKDFFIE